MNTDEKKFTATCLGQFSDDSPIDVIDFNGLMAVCAEEGPIVITKEQAMQFFNLTERTTQ